MIKLTDKERKERAELKSLLFPALFGSNDKAYEDAIKKLKAFDKKVELNHLGENKQ